MARTARNVAVSSGAWTAVGTIALAVVTLAAIITTIVITVQDHRRAAARLASERDRHDRGDCGHNERHELRDRRKCPCQHEGRACGARCRRPSIRQEQARRPPEARRHARDDQRPRRQPLALTALRAPGVAAAQNRQPGSQGRAAPLRLSPGAALAGSLGVWQPERSGRLMSMLPCWRMPAAR